MRLMIVILLIAVTASELPAADIGVVGGKIWSDKAEFGNPDGWGLFVSDRVIERVTLHLEYQHLLGEGRSERWINAASQSDNVIGSSAAPRQDNTYDSYDVILFAEIWNHGEIGIEIGPGMSLNRIEILMSGTEVNPERERNSISRFGLSFTTRLIAKPVSNAPIRTNVSFKLKHILGDDTQRMDTWTPYADGLGLLELSIGIAYIFD
ncbi:MAG: hypothetical protein ABIK83_10965 [Candidatus Zixiibacteriota bacterium]